MARDPQRTRDRILAAALVEFSAKGFAGARINLISRRARVNKRMLYHYFGAKEVLYREVLMRKLAERANHVESTPDDPAGAILHWYDLGSRDLDWVRMLQWEALGSGNSKVMAESVRRALYEKGTGRLKRLQAEGRICPEVDPKQLFISILALTMFPLAFPQMARMTSGLPATDPVFRKKRIEFLRWFASRLTPPGAGNRCIAANPRNRLKGSVTYEAT
ncbi:MAG TPA: TetR/AcrR family transcriptional regulator [Candidatus Binataceae bacterium]